MGAAEPDGTAAPGALRRLARDARVRRYGAATAAVAALVLLWGGYGRGWQWTGFQQNNQVWDWLHLLLLPVVFGTLPLWIRHGEYISRTRRASYAVAVAAFIGFVVAGYLVPLPWTGFKGQTLWTWFGLVLLPVALISLRAWPSADRPVRPYHKAALAVGALAWVITVVGGYAAAWTWTGYQGNTLWDWLQLLLLPLVFPTILLPALLRWISGDAEARAQRAAKKQAGQPEQAALSQARTLAGPPALAAPPGRGGRMGPWNSWTWRVAP